MLNEVTIHAPDYPTALERVAQQLGDNAYIVSTKTVEDGVEIIATLTPPKHRPRRQNRRPRIESNAQNQSTAHRLEEMIKSRMAEQAATTGQKPESVENKQQKDLSSTSPAQKPQPTDSTAQANKSPTQSNAKPQALDKTVDGDINLKDILNSPLQELPQEPNHTDQEASAILPQNAAPTATEPVTKEHPDASKNDETETKSSAASDNKPAAPNWLHMQEVQRLHAELVMERMFQFPELSEYCLDKSNDDITAAQAMAQQELLQYALPKDPKWEQARVKIILGEPGVGKTHVLTQLAISTKDRGRSPNIIRAAERSLFASQRLENIARVMGCPMITLEPELLRRKAMTCENHLFIEADLPTHPLVLDSIHALHDALGPKNVAILICVGAAGRPHQLGQHIEPLIGYKPHIIVTKTDISPLCWNHLSGVVMARSQLAGITCGGDVGDPLIAHRDTMINRLDAQLEKPLP